MNEMEFVPMYKGKVVHFYEKSFRDKISFYLVTTQLKEEMPYILYTENPKFINEERMTKEQAVKFIKQEFNRMVDGGYSSFLMEMWVSSSVDLRKKKPEIFLVKSGVVAIFSSDPDITIKKVCFDFVGGCELYRCTVNTDECLKCKHCERVYKLENGCIRAIGCSYQEGED